MDAFVLSGYCDSCEPRDRHAASYPDAESCVGRGLSLMCMYSVFDVLISSPTILRADCRCLRAVSACDAVSTALRDTALPGKDCFEKGLPPRGVSLKNLAAFTL